MKQVIKLDVMAPGSAYDLSITGVYQCEDKLIALGKLNNSGMIGTCALTPMNAAVAVDVDKQLPVEMYLVGKACGEPKGYKEMSEEEAQKLTQGLTALTCTSVDAQSEVKEVKKEAKDEAKNEANKEASWGDKAKAFMSAHSPMKDRNTMFATAAVAGAVVIAGACTILSKRM